MKSCFKIIFAVPMLLALTMVFALPVYASDTEETQPAYHHVLDSEGILSEENSQKIEEAAAAVLEKNGVELFAYVTGKELKKPDTTGSKVYGTYAGTDASLVMMIDKKGTYLRP